MTADALWAKIAANPDAPDGGDATYLVYADAVGGEVGERIVLMQQHPDGPVLAAYLEKQRATLYGPRLAKLATIHWDWHLGFLRSVTYMPKGGDDHAVVAEILALPAAALLRELVVFARNGATAHYADLARPPTLAAIDVVTCTLDLATALADPDHVRWLAMASDHAELPPELWRFADLRWLELRAPQLVAIPPTIARLSRLFRLDLECCVALDTLPDELWAMESMREVSVDSECFGLRDRYNLERLGPLVAGFARARTPGRRRVIEASLLIGETANPRTLATTEYLMAALDSNIGDVRAAALAELQHVLPDPFAASGFPARATFALVGKTNYDKQALKTKLAERGGKLAGKVTTEVTHAIVGETPGGKQFGLAASVVVALETHLRKLLEAAPPTTPATPAGPDLGAIRAQLRSRDEDQTRAAIAALQDGVDPSLYADLVVVVQDTTLKKSRDGAKKLLTLYAPPAVSEAMREHLKVSVLVPGMGEANRFARLSRFAEAAGTVDGLDLARLLVARASVGTQYVFARGDRADARAAIAALLARHASPTELHLQAHELAQVPAAIADFPQLETIHLDGNRFVEFPRELLDLPRLRKVDLARNRVHDVPHELAATGLASLSLAANALTTFPMGVLAVTSLRELDLSSTQTYMPDETRITGLPDGIRALQRLERLRYHFNILRELPDGLFTLPALVELDFMMCELPDQVPLAQLARLPKLARLDVRFSTWRERQAELAAALPNVTIVA
ncbi:MAG: hypothetical protein NT062_11910 [Proteobacteria bacterium]|nr:hypothetical protein [Pseudomonadota bacterium]